MIVYYYSICVPLEYLDRVQAHLYIASLQLYSKFGKHVYKTFFADFSEWQDVRYSYTHIRKQFRHTFSIYVT